MDQGTIRQLFFQLRRRKVIRVVVAYAVLAWVLIEASSVILPALLVPEWVLRLIVIIALLGIVPTIVLAWIFDLTPHGIERTDMIENTAAQTPAATSGPPEAQDAFASIAVLPFKDLSTSTEFGALGDGIAAEIHSRLCKLHRVRVAARRSSLQFRDSDASLQEISDALKVRYVLSGNLLGSGDHLRIIAELDDAKENTQLWSRTYERDTNDVLQLMSDLAEGVVGAFGGERLRSEINRAIRQPTESLDAWGMVQKARAYILNYSRDSMIDAEKLLRRAIELDPRYAAAHAALGSVLAERVLNGFTDDMNTDSAEAIAASRRALAQASEDPFVLKMSGMVSSICGDPESAIESLRSSVEIAPYDFGAWGYLGWPLTATNNMEHLAETHRIMDQNMRTAPEHPGLGYWLYHKSAAFTCEGDLAAAREFSEKAISRHQALSWVWLSFANVLGRLGEDSEAQRAIGKAAQLNERMTPAHFVDRIRVMTASDEVVESRTAGLQQIGMNGRGQDS